jgi:hypothetical protein
VAGRRSSRGAEEKQRRERAGLVWVGKGVLKKIERLACGAGVGSCDNSPRKILYYRLNQSTLVIKQ